MVKFVLVFSIFILLLRIFYILYGHTDLSPEEAQYWLWSKHLDISYYSKPPLIAYMNAVSTAIFGDTELGVRINAVILGFFISILTYFFAKEIFKNNYFSDNRDLEKFAFFSVVFVHGTVGFNLASILFLTDTPLLFFYTLTLFFLWKAINQEKLYLWIFTGISAGLGFLAKYSIVLIVPPALIFLLIFKRDIFKKVGFYLSLLIATLFTIPVLFWNYKHNWVSFKHVSNLEGSNIDSITLSKSVSYLLTYLGGQILIISLFLFPFILYTVVNSFKEKKKKEIFYLTIFPIFVFLVFFYIAIKKKVYANWPAFAYISLFILTTFYIYKRKLLKWFYPMFILSILVIVLLFYTPLIDKVGLTNLLPPKRDPTKRLIGWETLGRRASDLINKFKLKNYFVFSETYQVASEMAFYIRPRSKVFCINIGRRMNQFDLWEDINIYSNKNFYGVYITKFPNIPNTVLSSFNRLVYKEKVPIYYRGKVVNEYYIYILEDFKHFQNLKTERY